MHFSRKGRDIDISLESELPVGNSSSDLDTYYFYLKSKNERKIFTLTT